MVFNAHKANGYMKANFEMITNTDKELKSMMKMDLFSPAFGFMVNRWERLSVCLIMVINMWANLRMEIGMVMENLLMKMVVAIKENG